MELDRFRKIRNGIKYYGENCGDSDAQLALEMAEKIIYKIKNLLNNK